MYNIIIVHFIFQGRLLEKYPRYKKQLKLVNIFIFWHNNIFGMISGVVGYKSTKYSNLLYLWLEVFFYSVGINYYYKKYKSQGYRTFEEQRNIEYFPVVFERYWYFTAYFGMFLFLPAINRGIQYLNKSELKLTVMSIIGVIFIWRNYMKPKSDVFRFNGGTSPIWLLTMYLIGSYIGKYRVDYNGVKKIIYCLICLFIYVSLSLFYNKLQYYELYNINGYYKRKMIEILKKILIENYDSILPTIQAVSLALFFLQIKYNKYLAKIICLIGPLAFAIYLIHVHPIVYNYEIYNIFNKLPYDLTLISIIESVVYKSLLIFVICIAIEYLRHLVFTFLRIRKICILLEKLAFKIFY